MPRSQSVFVVSCGDELQSAQRRWHGGSRASTSSAGDQSRCRAPTIKGACATQGGGCVTHTQSTLALTASLTFGLMSRTRFDGHFPPFVKLLMEPVFSSFRGASMARS